MAEVDDRSELVPDRGLENAVEGAVMVHEVRRSDPGGSLDSRELHRPVRRHVNVMTPQHVRPWPVGAEQLEAIPLNSEVDHGRVSAFRELGEVSRLEPSLCVRWSTLRHRFRITAPAPIGTSSQPLPCPFQRTPRR